MQGVLLPVPPDKNSHMNCVAHNVQDVLGAWNWQLDATTDAHHLAVLSVPVLFGHVLPAPALASFLGTIGNAGSECQRRRTPDAVQTLLQSVACRSAIMFGQRLAEHEAAAVVGALACTRLPMHCAHGRPTTAHMTDLATLREALTRQRKVGCLNAHNAAGKQPRSVVDRLRAAIAGPQNR